MKLSIICLAALSLYTGGGALAQPVSDSLSPLSVQQPPQSEEEIAALQPDQAYSLPWPSLRESDILWKKRVWRTIDLSLPQNQALAGQPSFFEVLITGLFRNEYIAYSPDDDRFFKQLPKSDFNKALEGTRSGTASGSTLVPITGYKIKEDWIFSKTEQKIVVRIIGIAPLTTPIAAATNSTRPLCWFYYPDLRKYLSAQKVTSAPTATAGMTWDQYFEGRNFNSKINKISDPKTTSFPQQTDNKTITSDTRIRYINKPVDK